APTEPVPALAEDPGAGEADEEDFEDPAESSRGGLVFFGLLVLIVVAVAGYWKYQEDQRLRTRERVAFLENRGAKMIEARRWPEADAAYTEIEQLRPGADAAKIGRRSIEAGMEEEQRQFVGYWSGEAIAAFDLGRLDDAAEAARTVLEKYPRQKEISELLRKIEEARITQARENLLGATKAALLKRRWEEAENRAKELLAAFPGDAEGEAMLAEIAAGRDKEAKDRARARELFAAAKVRDQGKFDPEAVEWLREAVALAPEDEEIAALYDKMAAYTRTIHVPGDYETVPEAVAAARDRDRVVVAEGTWTGPVIADKSIQLEGAGRDKTIIEVEAAVSTAATFGRNAGGARISGITFRHRGFDAGPNRFSALLVRGAEITMNDCRVADSAGHGIAVVDDGRVGASRCVFENNGWDGVAVRGAGSRVEFSECESTGNFGHGFDLWDGGSAAIHGSIARDNSANGILVDTNADDVVIGDNDLRGNREYGIVVSSASSGRVHGNVCRENLLGGMAVGISASQLSYDTNKLEKNHGPGLVLEQGLDRQAFASNVATGNPNGKNVVTGVNFSRGQ
ncbi:right-handed parallel beta-helix repeat-containing protein, partial [Luteolibacter marinus]|uniref:right-handed parallel beta-helix repeat-containing protein n=1 Tax=Luteolibacter marinus TaxID=2776705 RepID=UPI0018666915